MALRWGRVMGAGATVIALGAVAVWYLAAPKTVAADRWEGLGEPNLAHGETLFWAGGCTGCHAADGASGDQVKVLSGGLALTSPFGTFHVPNISPDPEAGIGAWTLADFGNAMTEGVGREGEHLYPSFPYTSYARMSPEDINDLYGYLKTLPASDNVAPPHELSFPYNMRIALGPWKLLFFDKGPRVELASADETVQRGQFLVEGPGHCGECHTPRNALGGLQTDLWLAGGPNPEGEGRIPNITPGSDSVGSWSQSDLVSYFQTGFTPDYDSAGGSMVEVQKNLSHLPEADLQAIAAYLKAVPARE
ncbi:mono/diheme cytochrome c family protein [Pseudorhizobium tarimense]|uniref:Mono/diheme cytochrome c family protein n=1 Tax=Pseudorhizobium tarimense TaxID=1079109 RepID=A0ABV2H0I0_9HYPH|nr:cytochrome c [Pseudorhizobium tarimense]MCJ8517392.1 cytochrome c [Pseudorhizobium tarimense]